MPRRPHWPLWSRRLGLLPTILALALQWSHSLAAFAPNHFLGTCLTQEWVAAMETQRGISSTERDRLNRLVHPFLRAALQHPRYQVIDPRTNLKGIYSVDCMADGSLIYGTGAQVNTNGAIVDKGRINGTLIVEGAVWASKEIISQVFAILAAELYGYDVSIVYISKSADITQRMSSVGAGLCTPVHVNLEVWIAGIELSLQKFMNESIVLGGIGYFGRSGLYTTTDFIQDLLDTTKYPGGPYFANFWKGFQANEPLIQAVSVSKLLQNSAFYPPTEPGVCNDGSFGCLNQCSKSAACTARENRPGSGNKECLVVVMMYGSYEPGYLQATMSNNGIPAYFCFLGYDAMNQYALYAQAHKLPVLFYHYEPDLFHIEHAGLFDRVFLPRPVPERVALTNSDFGENGYGKATNNPVDVDFPSTKLSKYVAALLFDDRNQGFPAGSLASKIAISELNMNDMLRKYITFPPSLDQPAPAFLAACEWLKENYDVWKIWLDRLPLCTFENHIDFRVSGCDSRAITRTITFAWKVPDPANASLPYTCDGGLTEYPPPLRTSRSCEWIHADASKWVNWIATKPACDASFYNYSVSDCDAQSKRTVHYYWLLPDQADSLKSLECDVRAMQLPDDVLVECEYVPFSSPLFQIVAAMGCITIALLVFAMLFVYVCRKAPIIKRSQYELLELMLLGGILVCGSALVYAGKPSALLCGARPLLVSSGFTTIFGALFVKSLRVYRVFMKSAMKRVTITALMMIKVLSVFYAVDMIILGVWFGADFPHPRVTLEKAPEFAGLVDRVVCHSQSFIFSALLMFWKAIVLLLGIYTSFLIRNVSADFQESIWIFSSSVMVLVCCLVVLPLAYLVDLAAAPFYGFLAGALLLCTTVVMSFMLVPKIFRLHAEAVSSAGSSKFSIASSMRASISINKKPTPKSGGSSNPSSESTTAGGSATTKYTPGASNAGRKISAAASGVVQPRNVPVSAPEI